jgi:hypothetical protein
LSVYEEFMDAVLQAGCVNLPVEDARLVFVEVTIGGISGDVGIYVEGCTCIFWDYSFTVIYITSKIKEEAVVAKSINAG